MKAWWIRNNGLDKVRVTGTILKRAGGSVLLEVEIRPCSYYRTWIPIARCDHIINWRDNGSIDEISMVNMPRWLAREKGLPFEEVEVIGFPDAKHKFVSRLRKLISEKEPDSIISDGDPSEYGDS